MVRYQIGVAGAADIGRITNPECLCNRVKRDGYAKATLDEVDMLGVCAPAFVRCKAVLRTLAPGATGPFTG